MTADQSALSELRQRDARLNAWLADVKPGDIVTVRLNSTDTLTGKVYEASDAGGTSLCVWTTVLRHGNGYPGGSYEPETADHAAQLRAATNSGYIRGYGKASADAAQVARAAATAGPTS